MDLFSIEKTKVTGNPAILTNSAKMALQGMTIYGRSEQTKTTGAQLLDLSNMSLTTNTGATVSRLDDGGFIINGTPSKQYEQYISVPISLNAGTYYISGGETKSGGVYAQIAIYKADGTMDWVYNRSFIIDGTEKSLDFMMQTGPSTNTIDYYKIYPMLNKGSAALPWEPYTGAKASPSLDYPQEIENAKPELYFTNANLLSYTCCSSNGLTAVKNSDGSMTITGTATSYWANITKLWNELYLTKGNYTFSIDKPVCVRVGIKHDRTQANDGKSFQTYAITTGNTSVKYIRNYESHYLSIFLEGLAIGESYNLTIKPTLCYSGSSATPYNSYPPPQFFTPTLNNGLPGIPVSSDGNYTDNTGQQWICDEVDLERGVYVQRVTEVVINQDTDIYYHKIVNGMRFDFDSTHKSYIKGGITGTGLCNYLNVAYAPIRENNEDNTISCYINGGAYARIDKFSSVDSLRSWLKDNPIKYVYALATPIEIPLTDSDIATYNSIRTYDDTTVVRATDDVGLSITYGRKISMANTTLKTRIILNNKTTDEWAQAATFVGLKGEFLVDSSTRKIKIGDGATAYPDLPFVNLTPEEVDALIKSASHSHSNKSVLDATTASFTTALLEKLNGIAAGANKTVVDSAMSSTSTNPVQNKVVNSALGGKVPTSRTVNGKALSANITLSAGDVGAIATSARGAKNGVASLDENGKVPSTQLPSYVDDVLEGYIADDAASFYKDSGKTSTYTPEAGKIYVDLNNNKTYRYSGSKYTVISETIALGETASTAYRGDRGKVAYDHSQSAHAPSNAERNIIVGIQKNGADVAADSNRKVNITVPTKTSQITNDSGFITTSATVAKANQLTTARKIDGVNFNGTADIVHFGTCSTAAGTAAKTVAVAGFNLVTGARVIVKFTVTNTAANPTLNVNGTGAKAIKYRGSVISTGYLAANRVYEFVYDGTDYLFMGDINTDTNTTYSAGAGITLSGTQFKHTNAVTAGTVKGDDSKTLGFGGTFKVPSITYDAQGHITSTSTTTMTMPATPTSVSGNAGSATKLATARNFSITGGATASAVSFNGTANVSLNVTSLDAAKLTIGSNNTLILDGTI